MPRSNSGRSRPMKAVLSHPPIRGGQCIPARRVRSWPHLDNAHLRRTTRRRSFASSMTRFSVWTLLAHVLGKRSPAHRLCHRMRDGTRAELLVCVFHVRAHRLGAQSQSAGGIGNPATEGGRTQYGQLAWCQMRLIGDAAGTWAEQLLQPHCGRTCHHIKRCSRRSRQRIVEWLRRPERHYPAGAYRAHEPVAHAIPQAQLQGPSVHADKVECFLAFRPGERRQTNARQHDNWVM